MNKYKISKHFRQERERIINYYFFHLFIFNYLLLNLLTLFSAKRNTNQCFNFCVQLYRYQFSAVDSHFIENKMAYQILFTAIGMN